MAVRYTEEQLNNVDKSFLIHLLLQQQDQIEAITRELHVTNEKMQQMMEQLILARQQSLPAILPCGQPEATASAPETGCPLAGRNSASEAPAPA